MPISTDNVTKYIAATGVRFDDDVLYVSLNDGREIGVPYTRIGWLNWLANAADDQRENWSIEPGGFAIFWDDLDDGIEVSRLLDIEPLT